MSNTFNEKTFQKTFDSYFWRGWGICGALYLLLFGLWAIVAIGKLTIDMELPAFLYPLIAELEFHGGDLWFLTFGPLAVGVVAIGAFSVGIVAIGACSIGIVAIGAFSVGVFAFGGNAAGIIAIGGGTSYSKSTGGRFDIGKALGVVAISPEAYGVYTLSYKGTGTYNFSPARQDTEAVSLFSRWLPKFKKTFQPSG